MNILKAFLLTALLIAIEVGISLGVYELIQNYIPTDYFIHYFGLMSLIPMIIAYLIILKVFKVNLNWKNRQIKISAIEINMISYLLIVTIGLELFDRPFFDFSKIVDYFRDVEIEPFEFYESSNISVFYRGISVLIIAPIFEELFFRKFLFTELLKKYSLKLSIIISSICFALIHLPSYRNLLPTFIFGIISCLIYRKTKNIFYTIILHFLCNLSWLFLGTYGESFYKWSFGLEYNFTYWILFGVGIILTLFGIKKITTANN